jgi:peptide/nickel transport system ATP-binding protein
MYLGRIVEQARAGQLFARPLHPYTASLLAAVPMPEPLRRRRLVLAGDPPSPSSPPTGCHFHPRCPIARDRCAREAPPLAEVASGRLVACFYPGELAVVGATAWSRTCGPIAAQKLPSAGDLGVG